MNDYGYSAPERVCIHSKACMLHRKEKPSWCNYDSCSEFIDENQDSYCQYVGHVEEIIGDIIDDILSGKRTKAQVWMDLQAYDEFTGKSWYEGISVAEFLSAYDNYHSIDDLD